MNSSLPDIVTSIMEINKEFLESLTGPGAERMPTGPGLNRREWIGPGAADKLEAWQNLIAACRQEQLNFWSRLVPESLRRDPDILESFSHMADNRFADHEWQENPVLQLLKQAYLLASENLLATVDALFLPPDEKRKLKFYTKSLLDALAPTNFFMSNPEAVKRALETRGESLIRGLENLANDLKLGRLSQTDETAFTLGENLAATPGVVIYENEILQLIQYRPTTASVFARPLLIIPPFINKFYILDLQPHNSFVKYCLDQGYQVFLISWVNPGRQQSKLGWDDYVEKGVLAALAVVDNVGGGQKTNIVAWCIGGTLLATALAVLAARKKIKQIASVTFLTTMLDFSEPGDLSVFMDEAGLEKQEKRAGKTGFIPGQDLFYSFSLIRANELIWAYVSRSYLQGIDPPTFDILYWNSDPTNQPPKLYSFFTRNLFQANKLIEPGALTVCGVPVDLGKIKTPSYFLATIDDHIISWKTTFTAGRFLSGPRTFVLGGGGHVAGVINPPGQQKKHYWVREGEESGPERWLESARKLPGSWWPHWSRWLKRRAGKKIAAPERSGSDQYRIIEDAPGAYVRKRIDFSGSLKGVDVINKNRGRE